VVERNAPDATFGWGVVFSEETLGALRDADYPSYVEITDTFARWSAIDVVYGGRTVRSGGHVFSAIARRRLLEILQRRCREVGVELAFRRELPDLDALADRDLVVAAGRGQLDGPAAARPPTCAPALDVHRSRFVWFGSDLPLDAFTFIFRATEHGMFQVHAYPFDAETSTFIVECTEGTWQAAGLDQAGEPRASPSARTCSPPSWTAQAAVQPLAVDQLRHRPLPELASRQRRPARRRRPHRPLHHRLGHQAGHGGRGRPRQALQRHPAALEAAFTDYELERQPVVERFQEAARDSASWFENVRRYDGFDPVQFACNLLTRSGRIGHLELTRRDPGVRGRRRPVLRRPARPAAGPAAPVRPRWASGR
jgi:anthraniloyl-CoA monooxygenase